MGILEVKLGSAALIFACGLAGGFLPLRFDESERSRRFLAVGNGFAGGIFLGAGLLHMLGDAQRTFSSFGTGYPIALLIAGCAFLAVLFLEMVALAGRENVSSLPNAKTSPYPFILMVVLSVHSLIAGAALGLEGSVFASFALLIAILAHKGSAALALGVSLKMAAFGRRRFIAMIALFSCMTPIGVLGGFAYSRTVSGETALLVEAVFDAMAAGSFVYVAVLDIIEEAFAEKVDLGVKFTVLTLGFVGMALLAVWT